MSDNIEMIPTHPTMGRSIVDHDSRNRLYPARTLFAADAPLVEKTWASHYAYDQGQNPWCVGYEGKGKLNTKPFSESEPYHRRAAYSFETFYNGAQSMDEWPGTDYDGTSARGMLRFLTSIGVISEYRWCFGIDDVLRTLSHHGPVGVGSWWKSGMWNPDPATNLLSYSGNKIGGHQWKLFGIHPEVEEVDMMNSWGLGWGVRGRARIKFDVLDAILQDGADSHTLITVN